MSGGEKRRFAIGVAGLAMSVLLHASTARATDPGQCVDANATAQRLRHAGKFTAAREQLRICVRPDCPGIVRDDCAQRLDELERLQPTVVFDARDGRGERLVDVKVLIDGQPFTSKLDGTALPVDAGPHMFTFEVPGEAVVGNPLVVNEGEKARHEPVRIGALVVTPPPAAPTPIVVVAQAPPMLPAEPRSAGGAQRAGGVAVGVLGLAAIGGGAALGVIAQSDANASKSDCSTKTCTNHAGAVAEYNNGNTAATISNIGFIGGGVLLAGGIVLFATAPSHAPASTASGSLHRSFHVLPSFTPQGAGMWMVGDF